MQQINAYSYDNAILVQYDIDPTVEQRNRVVYTRTLDIYKGVDNVLKVKVQNADQKPINIANLSLSFNLVDAYVNANATVVLSANVTVTNASAGLGSVTLTNLDLVQLEREQYNYNIKINNGTANIAAYVGDNYNAIGQIRLIPSAYPVNTPGLDLGQVGDGYNSLIEDFGNI